MNENPHSDGNGAIKSPHDGRDYLYTDVAFGSVPFDWSVGFDAEKEMGKQLGFDYYFLPIKDQNGSGSCGGQAEAYGGSVLATLHDGVFDEKSAKFTYAPVAVAGGGSTGRDLAERSRTAGWGSESLTSSYENGKPPSEAFMERKQDITSDAIQHALKDRALNYTILPIDIDTIAQAIRDFKFVRIGVVGTNNGTWWSADPVPTKDGDQPWYHWVCLSKATMRNGKKAVGFPNSWGDKVGDHGWQWLSEDWFKAHLSNNPYGTIPLFEPRCYTWNEQSTPPVFHHTFNKDLEFNMVDPENQMLQTALRIDGEFPNGIPYNDRFGGVTLMAVKKFQLKYGIVAETSAGYGRCGPLTRKKLNELFSK